MNRALRLAFVLPALLLAAPSIAQTVAKPATTIRYVTLDKMIHDFAAQARQKQAARPPRMKRPTVLAQR